MRLTDREVFGVAGLWERSPREDGSYVVSCTLITLPANRLLAQVHNEKQRMPAILAEERSRGLVARRLSRRGLCALKPYPDELLVAWQVSRRVNHPKLPNDASLIEHVPSDARPG